MKKQFIQSYILSCRRTFYILIYCCSFYAAASQPGKAGNEKIPSGSDTLQANELNALSKKYWYTNLDSSVYYAEKALHLSQRLNYKKGTAESYRNIGATNLFAGDKNIAEQYLLKALRLFSASHNENGMAATYNNLGVLHNHKSEFSPAFFYYDSALVLFRKLGDKEGEGSVLNYIGINYMSQGNYQKAIDYCLQGYEIRKAIQDHPGVVFSLINVGNMYLDVGQPQTALTFYNQSVTYARAHNMEPFDYSLNQIGRTYLKLKQYDKAEAYLIRTINGKKRQVNDNLAVGELYYLTGRLDSATRYFQMHFSYTREGINVDKAMSLAGLSKVYLTKGEYGQAISYAKEAYDVALKLQSKLVLADVASVLAEIYKNKGDYKEALRFGELAHSIADSITGENYQRKLAFTETKNEIENEQAQVKVLSAEKELQKQKLKDEQLLKNLILFVFAVAVILSFIIIRNINGKRKKIQSQKDQIELQKTTVQKAYEELKSAQALLIQREKMASLGELTAGIAHEIQNPLNFVNNFSEVNAELIEEMKEEMNRGNVEEVKSIANDIRENEQKISYHGKRADAIVKGMLQHSRQTTGTKEPTDINALCDEYLRLAYHGLRAKDKSFNATLQTDFDKKIEKINILPQEIGRVLLNLYTNAFYTINEKSRLSPDPPNGEPYQPGVIVSTKLFSTPSEGRRVQISIQDNGTGIPQKDLDKIFQPFFTTKPTGEGTGLGLSLSYDIIRAHGGDLRVESRYGEGSEFIIQLPV